MVKGFLDQLFSGTGRFIHPLMVEDKLQGVRDFNSDAHPLLWISCRHGIVASLKGARGQYVLLAWNH